MRWIENRWMENNANPLSCVSKQDSFVILSYAGSLIDTYIHLPAGMIFDASLSIEGHRVLRILTNSDVYESGLNIAGSSNIQKYTYSNTGQQ